MPPAEFLTMLRTVLQEPGSLAKLAEPAVTPRQKQAPCRIVVLTLTELSLISFKVHSLIKGVMGPLRCSSVLAGASVQMHGKELSYGCESTTGASITTTIGPTAALDILGLTPMTLLALVSLTFCMFLTACNRLPLRRRDRTNQYHGPISL